MFEELEVMGALGCVGGLRALMKRAGCYVIIH